MRVTTFALGLALGLGDAPPVSADDTAPRGDTVQELLTECTSAETSVRQPISLSR
jgi:hypothetical protein